jgi:hypothetical protein
VGIIAMLKATASLRLPTQNPPVSRKLTPGQGHEDAVGVQQAQSPCDKLPGLARQMCYAVETGTNI